MTLTNQDINLLNKTFKEIKANFTDIISKLRWIEKDNMGSAKVLIKKFNENFEAVAKERDEIWKGMDYLNDRLKVLEKDEIITYDIPAKFDENDNLIIPDYISNSMKDGDVLIVGAFYNKEDHSS